MKDVILKKLMQGVSYLAVGIMLWWFWCALRFTSAGMMSISYENLSFSGTCLIYGIIVLILLCLASRRIRQTVVNIGVAASNNKRILFITLIIIQVIILLSAGRVSFGWDPAYTMNAALPPSKAGVNSYFSSYPNNLGILYYEHFVASLINIFTTVDYSKLVFVLCLLNIVTIDLCLIWGYKIIEKYNRKYASRIFVISCILVGLSGYILIVYTDIACWPFLLLAVEIALRLIKGFNGGFLGSKTIIALSFILGFDTIIIYRLKPSAVIPVIALLIVLLVIALSRFDKAILVSFLVFAVSVGGSMYIAKASFDIVDKTQTIVRVNSDAAMPMTHFIAMGLNDNGGYNGSDVERVSSYTTTEQKDRYSKKVIKYRLKEYGVKGYAKFLLKKSNNFMADGSWGYGKEGDFLVTSSTFEFGPDFFKKLPSTSFLTSVRNYIKPGTPHNTSLRLLQQLMYIVLIGMLLYGLVRSVKQQNADMLLLWFSLVIIGIVAFLLLFESGRSRYLLQFYPILSIMAGVSCGLHTDNNSNIASLINAKPETSLKQE